MVIQILLLLNFFFTMITGAPYTFYFFSDFDVQWRAYESTLPEEFLIDDIRITSDFKFDVHDIVDITYFKKHTYLNKDLLKKSLLNLQRKQKFESITIECNNDTHLLELRLTGIWTIRRIISKGSLIGKDYYKRFYHYAAGDQFEEQRHEQALHKVRDALQGEGYFKSEVDSRITYNSASKEVDITLIMNPGKHYSIKHISIDWQLKESLEDTVIREIEQCLTSALTGNYYSRGILQAQCEMCLSLLKLHGVPTAEITPSLIIYPDRPYVDIEISISQADSRFYEFVGNSFFTKGQLLAATLVCDTSLPWLPLSIITEEIETLYKNHGFLHAKVSAQEKNDGFLITVNEQERSYISSLAMQGMYAADVHELKIKMTKQLLGKPYNNEVIDQCCDQITAWYLERGYWDVTIERHQVILPNDGLSIVLTIHENKQRLLSEVHIDHILFINDPVFTSYKILNPPIPFDVNIISEQQHYIRKILRAHGILYGTCIPHIVEAQNTYQLHWELRDITPVKFGKTIILGCARLPMDIIKRELEFEEGCMWSDEALTQSVQRLRSLSLFDSVSITPADIFTVEPEKNVIIRIAEAESFEIRTRCGAAVISKNATLRGGTTYQVGVTFLWKNPRKRGDILRVNGDFNRYALEASVSYFMPWFFGRRHGLKLQSYASYYEQPFVAGSRDILYHLFRIGTSGQSLFNRSWGEWSTISGLEIMRITGLSRQRAEVLRFEPQLIDKFIPYFLIEPTVFLDYLDNKIQPCRGSLTVASVRGMFPVRIIPQSWYIKILLEQSFFFPLVSNVIVATRFRIGHIFNAIFENIIPSERFYLGGPHSIRSYQPDLAPPLNFFDNDEGKRCWVPIGGKSLFNMNIELRFPLFRNLRGVVFSDLGALSQNTVTTLPHSLLTALGFGFRYETPVGPIRFDFGWTVGSTVRSYAWYLALGNAF